MGSLWNKLFRRRRNRPISSSEAPKGNVLSLQNADAIITPNEVNDRHGTGVIVHRVFGQCTNVLSIRSQDDFEGEHHLGAAQLVISHQGQSRRASFARLEGALQGTTVRRILCVPFFPDDLVSAIVLKELFGVPLCTYVMDDNNIIKHGIPDDLMRETLAKSDLRLAISRELLDEYEKKYGLKFWLLPPTVTPEAVRSTSIIPSDEMLQARRGVMIGSLWSRPWLKALRQTVRDSGVRLDWYGNARAAWLEVTPEDLAQDGITDCGFVAEAELTRRLADYCYAVVPSGWLGPEDDRPEIARMSLPTRMPYLVAAANLPMLVLGHRDTAAARFVERLQVGSVCAYDGRQFRSTVQDICGTERQRELRRNAAQHGPAFSAAGIADWIWKALERGEPEDDRFGRPMPRDPGAIIHYVEPPAPRDIWQGFVEVYQAVRRLKEQGFRPDFVMDVGSSTGIWSDTVHRVFPQARFILVDPLQSRYVAENSYYFKQHQHFERVEAAVSDRAGTARFQVSGDLYGSSLLQPEDHRSYVTVEVTVKTLDRLAGEKKIAGRGLLKIDVQGAEHLVLEGARELLPQVDALLLELSLVRLAPQAKVLKEMLDLVAALGFRVYDETGGWRCPVSGTLLQKDLLFVREGLFPYPLGQTS